MIEERRPDPDLILDRIRQETQRRSEGELKIFFGAAPGVGKTYAMLEAAQRKRAEGVDVIVGLVETHKRKETEALLEGLEVMPRLLVDYRGTTLSEFDIDAVLKRKPSIILVDELAHTNAPGSRHKKRWQDVYELLGAGINVYSTINVQHLESLNDVVTQITGISVHETVPDFLLDRADEIELVDLPPDDLLQRLKEGKVYVPELAAKARQNFFRKGNLLALRELALRRTAERVDEQMQRYREVKGVKAVWPVAERILVCVGPNPRSIRLIRAAKRMAAGLRAEWMAVYVEAPHKVKPSESDLRQLAEHMRLAESLGAETVTLSGHKASEEVLTYARGRNITKIIVGKPTHPRWKDQVFGSMLDEMVRGSGEIDVYVIAGDTGEPAPRPVSKTGRQKPQERGWLLSIAIVGVCTGIAALMFPYVAVADLAMVYLLGAVIIAARAGKAPSCFAALLSVVAFDFFFVPPRYMFSFSSPRYLITSVVMFIVAFVISRLTIMVRDQANAARQRERRTAALYSLSRKLVHARGIEQLSAIAVKHISEVFASHVVVLVPDERETLTIPVAGPVTGPVTFALDQKELSVAQWAFTNRKRAGLGTDTLSGAKALYLPLGAASKTVGVLGVLPSEVGGFFDQEQVHVLESFSDQIAMAIDRAMLSQEAQLTLLKAETETLQNTLLTRLESGAITVKKEWQPFEAIVGAMVIRLSERLKDRSLTVSIPADLPLVAFDPLLMEQVLMNILDNAMKYTPQGTPIELSAAVTENDIIVKISDRGPGIPPGEEKRILEKFVRGTAMGVGIGLGLAVCETIITSHGGRIWVESRPGGGAVFCFSLPIGEQPPRIEIQENF